MKDEALKLALAYIQEVDYGPYDSKPVITAIKQALAAQQVPVQPVQEPLMVDIHPPATQRDRWMYEQGRLAERDPRSHPTPPAQPAVPDAIHHTDLSEHPQYIQGWNDCRAEMLKGMKP
jgi:hypothetical protein